MYWFRWLISAKVRQASYLERHVRKLRNAQKDILNHESLAELDKVLGEMRRLLRAGAGSDELRKGMDGLESAGNQWLRPYPNAGIRENVEVALVAIAVAMGIRTFFLQPFKIPTGSMQPTLYGIHMDDLRKEPEFDLPSLPMRIFEACAMGRFYHVLQAEDDGEIEFVTSKRSFLFFIDTQSIGMAYQNPDGTIRHKIHRLFFSPEGQRTGEGVETMWLRSDLGPDETLRLEKGRHFHKGDYILKVRETAGDHLFVDRFTYNFRHPTRGEIIVFDTSGIVHPGMAQNTFYIKRMVAMDGEKVRIGDDRHLVIDGVRLDAGTPHFENVYGFDPDTAPAESEYSGHVNGRIAEECGRRGLSPLFPDEDTIYEVETNHYIVMGDNTLNSFDSRSWGDFREEKVIGKSFLVYWPISKRFGWGQR